MATFTEQVISLPIINPDPPHGKAKNAVYMGKTDRVEPVACGDGHKIVDWKTSSDPQTTIREKVIGFQPYLYALAWEAAGCHITEVEYRIIKKPTISLCGKDDKGAQEKGCSPELYHENRCVKWLREDPQRRIVPFNLILNPSRMAQAKAFLWDGHKRILENRRYNRWLPNEFACKTWSKDCEFCMLCEAIVEGSDVEWLIEQKYDETPAHPELGSALSVPPGTTVHTHTSLSTLTLCEMRFYWRYERKIRRRREHSDALWVGSAVHTGMEAFAAGGAKAAVQAIDDWRAANPALGEDVRKMDQLAAQAKAMVRVAAEAWPVEG